ncbi:hypothetical protein VTK73DRAFT_7775 [Phialemonium thermophilum]|uniref:Secreted protein n=1 Tax=Phialemonium thermophilum TaxID=223376 RepID=A0ABR3XRH1_9PEZI
MVIYIFKYYLILCFCSATHFWGVVRYRDVFTCSAERGSFSFPPQKSRTHVRVIWFALSLCLSCPVVVTPTISDSVWSKIRGRVISCVFFGNPTRRWILQSLQFAVKVSPFNLTVWGRHGEPRVLQDGSLSPPHRNPSILECPAPVMTAHIGYGYRRNEWAFVERKISGIGLHGRLCCSEFITTFVWNVVKRN